MRSRCLALPGQKGEVLLVLPCAQSYPAQHCLSMVLHSALRAVGHGPICQALV